MSSLDYNLWPRPQAIPDVSNYAAAATAVCVCVCGPSLRKERENQSLGATCQLLTLAVVKF